MKSKEEEERQRQIESKEELLAVLKADKIFQDLEKEKSSKPAKRNKKFKMLTFSKWYLFLLLQEF